MDVYSIIKLVWIMITAIFARPDGLPWPDSCESLSPGNGIPPQTGPMPFRIVIDSTRITSSDCIYFTIKGFAGDRAGTNEVVDEFAGFMVQARDKAGKVVGTFRQCIDVRLMDCFGKKDSTAININYIPKEEVIMRWFPDSQYNGTVRIYASIAKDYNEEVYWVKQRTRPIHIKRDTTYDHIINNKR